MDENDLNELKYIFSYLVDSFSYEVERDKKAREIENTAKELENEKKSIESLKNGISYTFMLDPNNSEFMKNPFFSSLYSGFHFPHIFPFLISVQKFLKGYPGSFL